MLREGGLRFMKVLVVLMKAWRKKMDILVPLDSYNLDWVEKKVKVVVVTRETKGGKRWL